MSAEIESINLINYIKDFLGVIDEPVKIGLLYNKYLLNKNARLISYKTFQRVILELSERELIFTKKFVGDRVHSTTTLLCTVPFKDNGDGVE